MISSSKRSVTRGSLVVALALLATSGNSLASEQCGETLPDTMRSVRIHAKGGPENLKPETIPRAQAAAGEVLVRVSYASVNPVDWKLQERGSLKFPAVPGGDFSGEVVALGAGVTQWKCGDRIFGAVDQVAQQGSYAEFLPVTASEAVRVPTTLPLDEAAALPTVAVAAWRFLVASAGVVAGERVLIHGGAGGVGSMAVQIAKAKGAYVIATASARNHAYLKDIGADEVVDYAAVRFEDVVHDVDLVFDTVGGDTLARSAQVIRDGGRLVSSAGSTASACKSGRIKCPAIGPWNVPVYLSAVVPLLDAGKIRVNIDRTFPLEQAAQAQQLNREGHTRGKIVLSMAPVR